MTTTTNPLADQAEQLALRELREQGEVRPYQWRNLVLAIQLGIHRRPLVGAVGTRINGETRLAVAFGPATTTTNEEGK